MIDFPTRDFAVMLFDAYRMEVEERGATFDQQSEVIEAVKALAIAFTGKERKFGALLQGNVGNGKTTLLRATQTVIRFINEQMFTTMQPGLTMKDAKELSVMGSARSEALAAIKDCKMLAIDDLGREPASTKEYGNVISPIIDLIEYRYDRQLFTIVSTNLTRPQLRDKYGDRVADRLREMMEFIQFKHESYRKQH